ncbi:hypothetical protein Hte_001115 [Hypoxylon texense]
MSGTDSPGNLGNENSTKIVRCLFEHNCRCCGTRWSGFKDSEHERLDLEANSASYPIIHRLTQGYDGSSWVTESITIQDESMRQNVLEGYEGANPRVLDWTFKPPFMYLVHRWNALKYYDTQHKTTAVKNALRALLDFLTPILGRSISSAIAAHETGGVTFDHVWLLFAPGTLVITKFHDVDTVCKVVNHKAQKVNNELAAWDISVEYVDWNGEESGYGTTKLTISKFEDVGQVTKLCVYPISFLGDAAETKAALIERGRKFERFRGYHLITCNGTKVTLETDKPLRQSIAGRACIDAYAYYHSCNKEKPRLRSLHDEAGITGKLSKLITSSQTESPERHSETTALPVARGEDLRPLTEEQLLMTTPWLKGFDLKTKDWCELCVDDLQEVTWNDEAFEKLSLPNNDKETALAFIKGKLLENDSGFDDFVRGKGRGLIILLFGPPGVGKTFTVEAIAEKARTPLYAMSAGELGTTPSEVERSLGRALELCRMWNAVMLLDEADIFLGARKDDSVDRNELVAIFLRMLEYYEGTLFLTTNRVASIDGAFQSRVDLFLPYRNLSKHVRRGLWESFLERAGRDKFDIMEEELTQISELDLNGREIKNIVKSSQLLSLGLGDGGAIPFWGLHNIAMNRIRALQHQDTAPGYSV